MKTVVTSENRDEALSGTPLFFRLLCRFAESLSHGSLVFILPDGREVVFQGEEKSDATGIIIVKDYSFARRSFFGGDIGFFESYADGQWDTPDLSACLFIFAKNAAQVQGVFHAAPLVSFFNNIRHTFNKNTRAGSKRNIVAHYDLGNKFYELWLDETMTYSSARFEPHDSELSEAQIQKYTALAKTINLAPDERVLEIGSGWGGFAEFAAKDVGARVVGITISPSQYEYARERIFREGLTEKVEFRLQDYRDVDETFDKVASIEMFEAVGREYWKTYFEKVRDVLNPGGIAGLQIITIADQFFDQYSKSSDFIQRYVFPGGALPSPGVLKHHIADAGLDLRSVMEFGQDYGRTLNEWHQRFLAAWDNIKGLGFDDRFNKLWRFYLAYCEAGFKAGTTNVCQVGLTKA